MTNTNIENKIQLPNNAFDSEYNTQFKKEMLYLKDRGISYTYVKRMGEYKIPTYKYTKTPELFRAVADFYEQQRNEKNFNALSEAIDISQKAHAVLDNLA